MIPSKLLSFAAAAALLAACDAQVGDDARDPANAEAVASAEGKSEEGTFSIDTPDFDMKIRIPKGLQQNAEINGDSKIFPPGATFRGMHIQGGEGGSAGVEMRFSDPRPPRELARWYEADAGGTSSEYTVQTVEQQGDSYVIMGETIEDRDSFTVRLTPRQNGGTDGRLAIQEAMR